MRPTGVRTGRCSGLQTQVREDLPDHWLPEDRRNDLQLATAVWAMLKVDLEDLLDQLGPAQTHLASMQTARFACGGRCDWRDGFRFLRHHQRAQFGVGRQDAVVRAAGSARFAKRSYADTKRIRCSLQGEPKL